MVFPHLFLYSLNLKFTKFQNSLSDTMEHEKIVCCCNSLASMFLCRLPWFVKCIQCNQSTEGDWKWGQVNTKPVGEVYSALFRDQNSLIFGTSGVVFFYLYFFKTVKGKLLRSCSIDKSYTWGRRGWSNVMTLKGYHALRLQWIEHMRCIKKKGQSHQSAVGGNHR